MGTINDMRIGAALVSTALALSLTGCSFSFGTPTVAEDTLETSIADQLEEKFDQRPDKVDCPGDLKGTVDEEMRCTLTAGEDELGLTVTVYDVEGEQVKYDIEVDEMDDKTDDDATPEQVPQVAQSDVETQVADSLEAQVGQRPDSIDCPGDLAGEIGHEMRCTLTDGADQYGLTVTVTEAEGTRVDFDIVVDDTPMS